MVFVTVKMDPGLEFGRVSKSVRHPQFNKSGEGKDKMRSLDAWHKVWVGGLTDEQRDSTCYLS